MDVITMPKINIKEVKENHSIIDIEPLAPGFGYTVANSLRRVMLSSLSGSAVTEVKIEGITHEFTSIPHIKEDALEIVLNIKSLKVKNLSDEPQIIEIEAKNPGKITAKNIKKNANIEIINDDIHIATIDKGGSLKIEMTVEKGRGFHPTEDREKTQNLGSIAIDASFSPVELVNYHVENTRVGQMTDYDKLILEVKTNGVLSPKEVLDESIAILIDQFKALSGEDNTSDNPEDAIESTDAAEDIGETTIDAKTKITDLELSSRTVNALINNGIKTVGGLRRLSDLKLSEVKGLGSKGFDEIKKLIS